MITYFGWVVSWPRMKGFFSIFFFFNVSFAPGEEGKSFGRKKCQIIWKMQIFGTLQGEKEKLIGFLCQTLSMQIDTGKLSPILRQEKAHARTHAQRTNACASTHP